MGNINRTWALILVGVIAISSLTILIVEPANAQTVTSQKPVAPEFTLTFLPASETLTNIDPLTGAKTFELVDMSTIEVKIKNQPFQENINGIHYYLYYSVFVTGHFDTSNQSIWQYVNNFPYNYTTTPSYPKTLQATTSEYTIATIWSGDYPSYSQIDVHVGAMLMHDGQFRVYDHIYDLTGHLVSGVVEGEISGSVQTFTIPEHLASTNSPNSIPTTLPQEQNQTSIPTTTQTSTPTVTNTPNNSVSGNQQLILESLIVAVAVLGVAVVSLLVYVRRITKRSPKL